MVYSPRRPPLWNRMVFPFAIHTHAHIPCLCECMALLSPNPPPVEQDGFPFCSETHTRTHTHTPRVCVCMAFSLRTCSSAKPPFHSLVCGPSGVRYGVRHACHGGPPGLEASGPCIWEGGIPFGGGGGRERTAHNHMVAPLCVCVCARPSVMSYHAYHVTSCTCTYVCMYVCMYACMYVCVYTVI